MTRTFRIGSRKSKLALAQTHKVISALQALHPSALFEVVTFTTSGDKFLGDLSKVGGKGAFVKEIEEAMLRGDIDMAMHSMKDVPNELPPGLVLAAMLPRHDMRDVVVCRPGESFVGLKAGAKVGTSSLRRASQIRANFPDLEVVHLRGNVDTRLQKLADGDVDAAVLAKAGLDLLGLTDCITEVFEPDMMMPAAGQGAVGVECRGDDTDLLAMLHTINHPDTFTCVTAERVMTSQLGGNCHTPIGGYCEVTKGGNLRMLALIASHDGTQIVRARQKMPYTDFMALGQATAEELLALGGKDLL